jgi:hypothetical protein
VAQIIVQDRFSAANGGIFGRIVDNGGATVTFATGQNSGNVFSVGTTDLMGPFVYDNEKTASLTRRGFTLTPTVSVRHQDQITQAGESLTITASSLVEVETMTGGSTDQLDWAANESSAQSSIFLDLQLDLRTEVSLTGSMSVDPVAGANSPESVYASFSFDGPTPGGIFFQLGQTGAQTETMNVSTIFEPGDYLLIAKSGLLLDVDDRVLTGGKAMLDFQLTLNPLEVNEYRWTNASGGNWDAEQNWDNGGPPEADNTAIFNLGGSYAVGLIEDAEVDALKLAGSGVNVTLQSASAALSANSLTLGTASGDSGSLTINFLPVHLGQGAAIVGGVRGATYTLKVTNFGSLAAGTLNVGTVERGHLVIDQSGSVTADTVSIAREFGNGSTVTMQSGGMLTVNDSLSIGDERNATFTVEGASKVTMPNAGFTTLANNSELRIRGASIWSQPAGSLQVHHGNVQISDQSMVTLKNLQVISPFADEIAQVNVFNGGKLAISDTLAIGLNDGGTVQVLAGGQLTARNITLAAGAASTDQVAELVIGDAGSLANISGQVRIGNFPAQPASLRIEDGARAVVTSANTAVLRLGELKVEGAGSEWIQAHGDLFVERGNVVVDAGGLARFDNIDVVSLDPAGTGTVAIRNATVEANDHIRIGASETGVGLVAMANGTLRAQTEIYVAERGYLVGTGTAGAPRVHGPGYISPGLSPGKLVIEGDFEQAPGGVLELEIGGLNAATQHDVFEVTGEATLNGTVLLNFIDGFAPQQGQQFELLNAGGAANLATTKFAVQNLAAGFEFEVVPSASGMSMTALNDGVYLPPVTWDVDADGDWSEAANWDGGDPTAAGVSASFLGAITTTRTVNIDGPRTVASLTFDNVARYTLAGPGPLQFDNGGYTSAQVTSGEHVISARLSIAESTTLTKRGSGTLTISGEQSHGEGAVLVANGGVINLNADGGANLLVQANASLNFGVTQHLAGVTIGDGGRATLTSGGNKNLVTNALEIAGGDTPIGTLDLTDNSAIVDYAGASPAGTVRNQILAGRGAAGFGATWAGSGITSSVAAGQVAAEPESVSVAYAVNGDLPLGAYTAFRGETVDESTVLIRFTRTADANLDGVVNDDDVTIVGATYAPGVANASWANGDFDYNGFVNDDDVTLLGAFYDPAAAPLVSGGVVSGEGVAAVPEPGAVILSLLGAVGIGILVRRRSAAGVRRAINQTSSDIVPVLDAKRSTSRPSRWSMVT